MTQLHFMGIGGIGMSGLARICRARGLAVSGCDAARNAMARQLAADGITVAAGHHPSHLGHDVDLLVYSSAVPSDHPELLEARRRRVRTISRGQLLGELLVGQHVVAVAGAHGKTTTSAMATALLRHAGWDPSFVVGGIVRSLGTNAQWGRGTYTVVETDESDGSFLRVFPDVAVVTNLDREHLNYYGTMERLLEAFRQFAAQVTPGGVVICCWDDPRVRETLGGPARMMTYGLHRGAALSVDQVQVDVPGTRFRVSFRGRSLGTFRLQVPGRHNVLNATAVIGIGLRLELPLVTIREALAAFTGTQRRFQVLRLPDDIWFVEDYAHHPAEIRATLSADTARLRHRLAVFQPHRYSRTQLLERAFSSCFDDVDGVIVTDIYAASEPPIPGVSGERLAHLIKARGHPCVRYVPRPDLPAYVRRIAAPGDTVFFLGAGDIGDLCHDVASQLRPSQRIAGVPHQHSDRRAGRVVRHTSQS